MAQVMLLHDARNQSCRPHRRHLLLGARRS
jgi:hypothetical protein